MTEPPSAGELAAQEDQLTAAEAQAAADASAKLKVELAAITAYALAHWSEDEHLRRRMLVVVDTRLRRIRVDARPALLRHFTGAHLLGVKAGLSQIGRPMIAPARVPALPPDVRSVVDRANAQAHGLLVAAAVGLHGTRSESELIGNLARAHKAMSGLEASASWGVNRAVAAGVSTVAETVPGAERLWIAERDACVHCLAYAGQIAPVGTAFPGGLTFGRAPLYWSPVPNPPLHPHCRCRLLVWMPGWDREYAEALKREARRSIARGWSMESESNSVRVDAAARLVERGVLLPKTVAAYAERAARTGRFPAGRRFPGTGGLQRR